MKRLLLAGLSSVNFILGSWFWHSIEPVLLWVGADEFAFDQAIRLIITTITYLLWLKPSLVWVLLKSFKGYSLI